MKVLSVKQPWAYLLCAGIKDIENRTWKLPEKYKNETILIHASGKYHHQVEWDLESMFTKEQWITLTEKATRHIVDEFPVTSAIIGSLRFTDCVINHPSIWAEKGFISKPYSNKYYFGSNLRQVYNWVVVDAVLFDNPITGVKGKLNFWDYPAELIECPACGKTCVHETDDPISRFTHKCEHCGFWITESDYQIIK